MRIQKILEKAKFSKEKIIAYHGTSRDNLESIIKNGLIINHNEYGWGSLEYDDRFKFSYAPHDKIYFTSNFRHARSIANIVSDDGGIIIVAEIQPKTVVMDEDEIFDILGNITSKIYDDIEEFLSKTNSNYSEEDIDKIVDRLYKKTINGLSSTLNKMLNSTTASHILQQSRDHVYRMVDSLVTSLLDYSHETDIREEQKALMNIFKHVVRNRGDDHSGKFAVPYNVGFKGANRIVGIVDIKNKKAWGKAPSGMQMVKTPMELLN